MRIRTIKPEFWDSESNGRLSRDARLLFIGMFCLADDHGRFRASPPILAGSLLPYDTDGRESAGKWRDELAEAGKIRVYRVNGDTYAEIVNFFQHQKIDKRYPSKLPSPPPIPADSRQSPPIPADPPQFPAIGTGISEQGVEQGTGSGEGEEPAGLLYPPEIVTPSESLVASARPVLGIMPEAVLTDLLRHYPEQWILLAVSRTLDRGKTGAPYLRGVLQSYKKNGGPDDAKQSRGSSRQDRPLTGPAAREAGKFDHLEGAGVG